VIENDVETIEDAIQRNMLKGDDKAVKQQKLYKSNMIMGLLFKSVKEQRELEAEREEAARELEKKDREEQGLNPESTPEKPQQPLKDRQGDALKEISAQMWSSTTKFDIDDSSNEKRSKFDFMVRENVVQKSLESDCFLYVEGAALEKNPEFLDIQQRDEDYARELQEENLSACDFDEEFENKFYVIQQRTKPKTGIFEQTAYFEKLFPSFKIQKPGRDYYGYTTFFLFLCALFVFMCYDDMSVDQDNYLKNSNNNIFKGDMVICLICVIVVIIIERYVNRTDTKVVSQQAASFDGDQKFFNKDDFFRQTTNRSMTVKLQTMNTQDLDIQSTDANNFLQAMYGGDEGNNAVDDSKTVITSQQKTKYVMHLAILVAVHVFCFWYLPITGNVKLYNSPLCDEQQGEFYGCKNFKQNPYLKVFYFILCVYLFLSALQIRDGLPIHKKPSSILQYDDNPLALIGAQVYQALPFIVEIRCLLDFTFSKTSLDIFQFWQLWMYHFELYAAKNGNISYTYKVLGSPTTKLDKCIFGVLFTTVFLLLLVGPLWFFSDVGGFVQPNPVKKADIALAFIISKSLSKD